MTFSSTSYSQYIRGVVPQDVQQARLGRKAVQVRGAAPGTRGAPPKIVGKRVKNRSSMRSPHAKRFLLPLGFCMKRFLLPLGFCMKRFLLPLWL